MGMGKDSERCPSVKDRLGVIGTSRETTSRTNNGAVTSALRISFALHGLSFRLLELHTRDRERRRDDEGRPLRFRPSPELPEVAKVQKRVQLGLRCHGERDVRPHAKHLVLGL